MFSPSFSFANLLISGLYRLHLRGLEGSRLTVKALGPKSYGFVAEEA